MLKELKTKGISRQEIIKIITNKFNFSRGIVYDWHSDRSIPWKLKEKIEYLEHGKELFYILGAMLGDGCIYYWKKSRDCQVKIYGEKEFIEKCATKLSICLKKKINGYYYKSYYKRFGGDLWFINISHKKLFILFKNIRNNLNSIFDLIAKGNYKENCLFFIEGFFDAEGCVKIIKEKVRKTPKICLDITNTNFRLLELIRRSLEDKLKIEARYSNQKAFLGKDGSWRQKIYHLRIYKKEYIRRFLNNISTIKLKPEKVAYVENWLNNGLGS